MAASSLVPKPTSTFGSMGNGRAPNTWARSAAPIFEAQPAQCDRLVRRSMSSRVTGVASPHQQFGHSGSWHPHWNPSSKHTKRYASRAGDLAIHFEPRCATGLDSYRLGPRVMDCWVGKMGAGIDRG